MIPIDIQVIGQGQAYYTYVGEGVGALVFYNHLYFIWIFYTIVVHDPMVCHDLDSMFYLHSQCHSVHMPIIRVQAITPTVFFGSG